MKKLLILMMVVSVASLASAGLTIGVGDVPDPVDSEIVLMPSDIVTITLNGDGVETGKPLWLSVVGPGTLNVQKSDNLVQEDLGIPDAGIFVIELGPILGDNTIMFDVLIPGSTLNILDGVLGTIEFHCEGEGDVQLLLNDGDTMELLDSLIIHQIPEPMTMALLGLGGLFLRRRK